MISTILITSFAIFLFLLIFLNFLSLPGNWAMAIVVLFSALFVPDNTYSWWFWIQFFSLLTIGEIAEFYLQIHQGKKVNASSSSNVMGIIGAIAGAFLGMPLFFGFGAILGTLAGAWIGSYLGERYLAQSEHQKAMEVAKASMVGKFLGILIKFSLGVYLVFYTAKTIFSAG